METRCWKRQRGDGDGEGSIKAVSVGMERGYWETFRDWIGMLQAYKARNMVVVRSRLDVRVGRLLSLLLFREISLVHRRKSALGILVDSGSEVRWLLQAICAFILCARHFVGLWG